MQSTSHQMNAEAYPRDTETATPARPEPLVPERLSVAYDSGPNFRVELAAGFRRLGRGVSGRYAYELAKNFYRSSGHPWARKLTRQIG